MRGLSVPRKGKIAQTMASVTTRIKPPQSRYFQKGMSLGFATTVKFFDLYCLFLLTLGIGELRLLNWRPKQPNANCLFQFNEDGSLQV